MAFVENAPGNADYEMEEGEIVDDLDDLSDISSEEEFLLRQRLQVLENYNNVLERKKAKDASFGPDNHHNDTEDVLLDLSEISATDLDDGLANNVTPSNELIDNRNKKEQRHLKSHHKPKRKKDLEPHNLGKPKDYKKKVHRKKKLELKVISESSEESDDEYRNKRRKLANAVALNRSIDKSSLHDRLQKMLSEKPQDSLKNTITEEKPVEIKTSRQIKDASCSPIPPQESTPSIPVDMHENLTLKETQELCELIDLCTDDDRSPEKVDAQSEDTIDLVTTVNSKDESKKKSNVDSDEDLEQLRQHALKSKALKTKTDQQTACTETDKPIVLSEDEDSDTTELRLICLKSALLKKAIEMKQKQKLKKRLSQSSITMQDDFLDEYKELEKRLENNNENNTDIESVDMDIGSDADEKSKDISSNSTKLTPVENVIVNEHKENVSDNTPKNIKDDDLEEDEDLLRAKLLTSLSKNLPNLVNPKIVKAPDEENTPPVPTSKVPENRIVINLGESDSEGEEHEATKNLTKMHMKLSEQIDFQQKLDMFLKSTRMEVEKKKLPDVVQNPVTNPPEKFVAKTVSHLPKSEQIEYRNLVKKMAELEKIKEARQATMNAINQTQVKETLKPRNVSVDTSKVVALNMLEEQVSISRKRIAEESARMMKLKEEATKLTQKYKIVANELKNISTAITLNKKEQRTVQNRLSKIRLQHQRLLNSPLNKHSKINGNILTTNRSGNLQKENNPMKDDYKNQQILKTVKVSIVNDNLEESVAPNTILAVQVDVTSNKKVVTSFPNAMERLDAIDNSRNENMGSLNENNANLPGVEKGGGNMKSDEGYCRVGSKIEKNLKEFHEYESPLLSLERANWEADPNAIMCPFEVGGNCKDPDCKYLHPKVPSQ